ncbi:hypothetical protein [Fulvivirga aurantia]|uniref:hypothetical protein n=1 Tax=Fulvivirga aurantia TaxID=2529383 RepID=UPI001FEB8968|nr:hypothetical protein [Fulvivirga aurantia]
MILMGYIIMGHSDWKKAQIKIFAVVQEENITEEEKKLLALIKEGRLPIAPKNIELLKHKLDVSTKEIINEKSSDADLTIVGFRAEAIKQRGKELFDGYDKIGNVLFVNTTLAKAIY